ISGAGESDYSLIATRSADFDLEPNDRIGEAQSLHGVHTVLGAIGNNIGGPDTDFYFFQVNAGDTLTLSTTTPSDQGGEFHNTLVPQIDLYDNFTNLVASNAGQPKNASITYVAQTAGTYFVSVSGVNGSTGEYVLDIEGATGRLVPPSVKTSVLGGHILQIVGDDTANRIGIVDTSSTVFVADDQGTMAFTGIDQIMVNTNGGDDAVSYRFVNPADPSRARPANLFVDLGAGNDTAIVDASAGMGPVPDPDRLQAWNVNILGGDGNDNIEIITSL